MSTSTQAELVAHTVVRLEEERAGFSALSAARKERSSAAQNAAFQAIGREVYDLITRGTPEDLARIGEMYRAEKLRSQRSAPKGTAEAGG